MKSNFDLIQNEQICQIQKKNGNFYLNQLSIEIDQVNEIKQQLEDTIWEIDNKIEDDENQLEDILYELQKKINRQRACNIYEGYKEESEIHTMLKTIKKKYEKILDSLQNEQDFEYLFIHPDYIDINNQTSIYMQGHIDINQVYCGYVDEYCQQYLEDLLATKQGIKLTLKRLSLELLQNPECHEFYSDDDELCHKNDDNYDLDFKQIDLTGREVKCDLWFMGHLHQQNLNIGPSIKKLSFDTLSIGCFNIQFQKQSINILQLETNKFPDLKYVLREIDQQQSLEIGIIVVDKKIEYIEFEDAKQLLECRYLMCLMNTQGERSFLEDSKYDIEEIENEKQYNINYDIYLFQQEQKQQQKENDNQNYILQNEDDLRLFNKPFDKKNFYPRPTKIVMNNQKAIFDIINKKFSSQLSVIATCQTFEGDFSLFRILYDLHEI